MGNGALKIGEVAQRLGVNPRTIRFYEAAGLLPPPRRTEHSYASAGHRLFSAKDLQRLEFIRQARLLDLTLEEIRDLVGAIDDGCCGAARPRLKMLVRARLPELRRRIAALRRLEQRLTALERTLPDATTSSRATCGGEVGECLSLEAGPLLQIRPLPARRRRQAGR